MFLYNKIFFVAFKSMSKVSYIFVSKFSLFAYFFILWIGATFLMYEDWSYLKTFQVMPKYYISWYHNLPTSTYIKNLEPVKILLVAFPRFEIFWRKHFLYKYILDIFLTIYNINFKIWIFITWQSIIS